MQVGYVRNDKRSIHFAPLIANAASPKTIERNAFGEEFSQVPSRSASSEIQQRCCARYEQRCAAQPNISVNKATTETLVKPRDVTHERQFSTEIRARAARRFSRPDQYSMARRL